MDITRFLNSKDIATYLRRIRYAFTPEQAMYVIHAAEERTLPEKHAAYEELIAAYPEHALRERRQGVFKDQTVASFLRTYMERENALLAELKRDGDDAVCTYDYFSKEDDAWCQDGYGHHLVYRNFSEALEDAQAENEDGNIAKITVTKRYFSGRKIEATLLPDGTFLKIDEISGERDEAFLHAFEWMWVKIPTPFKFGDILAPVFKNKWEPHTWDGSINGLVVLTDMATWGSKELKKNGFRNTKTPNYTRRGQNFAVCDHLIEKHEEYGDESDMILCGYFLDGSDLCYDHTLGIEQGYLNYERFRGELKGHDRMLRSVSNFLKGELELDLMLKAHRLICAEEECRAKMSFLDLYTDEGLTLAGIGKENKDRNTRWGKIK